MKKLITILVLLLVPSQVFALAPIETNTTLDIFSDITAETPFYNGIELLKTRNIVNGYKDGTYRPEKPISRAEMLKIVIESAINAQVIMPDIESFNGKECFSDIDTNQWYNKYVCYAKDAGFVVGYDNGTTFKPNRTVSFIEGLKMSMTIFNYDFTEDGSTWYEDMVNKASKNQLIPNSINSFKKPLNRGEMSDMAGRVISKKEGKLKTYLGDKQLVSHTFESIQSGTIAPTIEVINDVSENLTNDGTTIEIETDTDDTSLVGDKVDTSNKDTISIGLRSVKNWATFDSLPFEFTCEYPELWYYFGTSVEDDDTVIRHYGFSTMSTTNEDESVNEDYVDMVSIDILSSADEIDGTSIATAGKELTISQVDGVFTVYLIVDEKPFRVSGDSEYKNIVLAMAKSIEHKVHEDDTEADDTNTDDTLDQAQSDTDQASDYNSNTSDNDSNQNTSDQDDTMSNMIN